VELAESPPAEAEEAVAPPAPDPLEAVDPLEVMVPSSLEHAPPVSSTATHATRFNVATLSPVRR
jgi:hypothetical protein